MYCNLKGDNFPRLFFSFFFVISIMVILNIVISFVLEIYAVSLNETQSRLVKLEYAMKLSKVAPD